MIIHIDTGKTWRGGQQQAFYLHQHLCNKGLKSIMICRKINSVLIKYCKEYGLPFMTLPLASEIDIYSAWKIGRFAKKNNGKILHLHSAHALSIGLFARLFCHNLKLIAVRRVDFSIRKNKLSFFKYNNKFLDRLVCISRNIYDTLVKNGVTPDKLQLIYSGIDTKRYALENNQVREMFRKELLALYNIPQNHIIIGTVAAYAGHKDYPTLLKAARIVLDNINLNNTNLDNANLNNTSKLNNINLNNTSNVTFVAIGGGNLEAQNSIIEIHKSLNLGNSFILAGFQEDVKKYLHFFDIFVLSSKMEGLGTSVLDAMSARKPIVACNSGGIPEMIKHEINGLLAEKENPEDLANKILRMLNDAELREKLSSQAEIDVQEFSILNTVTKNIDLYKELDANVFK